MQKAPMEECGHAPPLGSCSTVAPAGIVEADKARLGNHAALEGGIIVGWILTIAVLGYFIGVRIVGRRYFALRHGLPFERNGLGSNVAGLLAIGC